MADRKELKLAVPGTVHYNYINKENNKRIVNVDVTDAFAEWFENLIVEYGMEFSGTSYPLKQDAETGQMRFIARSSYEVSLSGMPKHADIEDIGEGSEVDLIVKIVEGEARGKKYISAYLLGIRMHEFVQKEFVDVFDDKNIVSMDTAGKQVNPD